MIKITPYWEINIFSLALLIALAAFHFISNMYVFNKRSLIYGTGLLLYAIATLSPLTYLGHSYLFSAHMVEHILLLLIIPALLIRGTNPAFFEKLIHSDIFSKGREILFYPITAWILGIFSMWILHIPAIFNFIMNSEILYDLQILALLLIGHVFLWPVFSPVNWNKLQPLGSAIYLFTACIGCTILGIFITFAPTRLFNLCEGDNIQLMNLIHSQWGISPEADQELGGLIMWVPACFVYLTYIMITLGKWYSFSENKEKKRGI